jgi:hypothetical protein
VHDFLTYIGGYNLLGAPLLFAMLSPGIADLILRRGTEIVTEPVAHLGLARLWLWWAASAQLFVGGVMLLARRWPLDAQRDVVACALVLYGAMYVALLVGGRRPGFGRGVFVTHALWLGQLGWGVVALRGS